MRLRAFASLLAAGVLQVAAAQAASPEAWLARMAEALSGTDYQGTLVYISGGQVEAMQVFHAASHGRERVVALNGAPRELVRDGERVTCVGTAPAPLVFDGGSLAGLRPLAEVGRSGPGGDYLANLDDAAERVAGRPAVALDVRPRDAYRYGYRLWLDRETALPLRAVLFDAAGQALEQLAFTEVEIGRVPAPEDLALSLPGAQPAAARADAGVEGGQWRVQDLPSGFHLRHHRSTPLGEHLMFSDGLASVSVYVEPAGAGTAADGATRAGAVNARSIVRGSHRIVAIGKVPPGTVERFVRGAVQAAPQAPADGG